MNAEIDKISRELESFQPSDLKELEDFRIHYLGKNGAITALLKNFKNIPNEQKKEYGQEVNRLKLMAQELIDQNKSKLESEELTKKSASEDYTLPGIPHPTGALHPLSIVRNEIVDVFTRIGFSIAKGPVITDDWHNFTALNMPENHPARDMQDTFFLTEDKQWLLRTHTSGVQILEMENSSPPVRSIAPGMVFRKDNDATHSPYFHQVEGIYVDKKVSFADLKQTLYYFVEEIFGKGRDIRFRPSYFPFTEPSAEMDISWEKNGKKDWMEILGCGMIDPAVLENCGIDPNEYSGYAFGIGIERMAMLKFGIPDIRSFYENDLRFLKQFKGY